jgi:hypothetical protein
MEYKYRTKIRIRYGIDETPYEDVVSHIFYPCCSLSQEFRELWNRGLDPALGIHFHVQVMTTDFTIHDWRMFANIHGFHLLLLKNWGFHLSFQDPSVVGWMFCYSEFCIVLCISIPLCLYFCREIISIHVCT